MNSRYAAIGAVALVLILGYGYREYARPAPAAPAARPTSESSPPSHQPLLKPAAPTTLPQAVPPSANPETPEAAHNTDDEPPGIPPSIPDGIPDGEPDTMPREELEPLTNAEERAKKQQAVTMIDEALNALRTQIENAETANDANLVKQLKVREQRLLAKHQRRTHELRSD